MTSSTERADHTERVAAFDLHGIAIEVRTDSDVVADSVARRLLGFGVPSDPVEVTFCISHDPAVSPVDPPTGARTVYDTDLGDVLYVDAQDRMVIDCGGVQVDARLTDGTVTTRYAAPTDELLSLAAHPLFTLPLLEVMKRRGRYPLHASCVSRGNLGLLFPGASGSGKSTLSVALARAGTDFVSDDMVFVGNDADALTVLGFADEVDLTDDSAARFPELAHLVGRPTWGARPKHQVRLESAMSIVARLECRPSMLLFPCLRSGDDTSFDDLTPDEALFELLPNVLLTDAASTQRHLDCLAELAATTPALRVQIGGDIDRAVTAIVERVGAAS